MTLRSFWAPRAGSSSRSQRLDARVKGMDKVVCHAMRWPLLLVFSVKDEGMGSWEMRWMSFANFCAKQWGKHVCLGIGISFRWWGQGAQFHLHEHWDAALPSQANSSKCGADLRQWRSKFTILHRGKVHSPHPHTHRNKHPTNKKKGGAVHKRSLEHTRDL
jgi:hypothetical protein